MDPPAAGEPPPGNVRKLATLEGHSSRVMCMATDGELVASGGWDTQILLWNAKSHAFVGKVPSKHEDAVCALHAVVSSGGKYILSGSSDRSLLVWAHKGTPLYTNTHTHHHTITPSHTQTPSHHHTITPSHTPSHTHAQTSPWTYGSTSNVTFLRCHSSLSPRLSLSGLLCISFNGYFYVDNASKTSSSAQLLSTELSRASQVGRSSCLPCYIIIVIIADVFVCSFVFSLLVRSFSCLPRKPMNKKLVAP